MTGDDRRPFDRALGARPRAGGGFEIRLWAPRATEVAVVVLDESNATLPEWGETRSGEPGAPTDPARPSEVHPAEDVDHGVFAVTLPVAGHGTRYLLRLDGTDRPDPWSRWQPDGVAGPSALVDPEAIGAVPPGHGGRPDRPNRPFSSSEGASAHHLITRTERTVSAGARGLVIYELHVGCFTEAGTFDAVIEHLDDLAKLGVTHVELMPVNEFPGDHGWGYDGIFWSAAHHAYGGPAGLVRLVDAAHQAGLSVILDVVYNHLGPTGDQIYDAHGPFFTDRHTTPWGRGINVDGPGSGAIRETILQSAEWWVGNIGVDGLRVDACHAIVDRSARPILAELTDRIRDVHPGALLIAESGLNDPRTVRPSGEGGWGFDADWADDFHHALRTLLTEDRRGWYGDFGYVAQLAKAFDRPYVHDGTWSAYRDRRFGAPPTGIDRRRFVVFDQNHDQIGNRPLGDRLPAHARPLAALCLLFSPSTPMLFMGEEYGEDAPFQFFSDHRDDFIADATRTGRRAEFADFSAATGQSVPDPQAVETFERSKLSRQADAHLARLYRHLIALRPHLPNDTPRIAFDEDARWLRVARGPFVMVANFSQRESVFDLPGATIQVATDPSIAFGPEPTVRHLTLPAWSGVLVRQEQP